MTCLAVRMSAEHSEAHLVPVFIERNIKRSIAFDADLVRIFVRMRMAIECGSLAGFAWRRRCEERVATLCTKEVLFVVCPFTQRRVIESDEPFVDNGRLAVVALGSERLQVTNNRYLVIKK